MMTYCPSSSPPWVTHTHTSQQSVSDQGVHVRFLHIPPVHCDKGENWIPSVLLVRFSTSRHFHPISISCLISCLKSGHISSPVSPNPYLIRISHGRTFKFIYRIDLLAYGQGVSWFHRTNLFVCIVCSHDKGPELRSSFLGVVDYESMKREIKTRPIHECR